MDTRRITGLIAAVVLALAGTLAIVAYVNGAEDRAQAGERIVKVLVVKESVPAGTPAKELGDRVGLEAISAKVMADGAVSSVKDLGGKVSGTTLVPGEQVIENRFVAKSSFSATGADIVIPPELLRTTISLEPQRALGGVLTPGSKVAIIASFDPFTIDSGSGSTLGGISVPEGKSTPNMTQIILNDVLVGNVQLTGRSSESEETTDTNTASSNKPGASPVDHLLVTVALDPESTEKLVFAMEFGHVWLSIQPAEASDAPTAVKVLGSVLR